MWTDVEIMLQWSDKKHGKMACGLL